MNGLQGTKKLSRVLLQRTSRYVVSPKAKLPFQSWSLYLSPQSTTTSLQTVRRTLSSSAATPAASSTATPAAKPIDTTSNIFLDNLGTIFLSVIGLIVGSLVRSYHGTNNKNHIRDGLEVTAALDPLEIDDLRTANSEMTLPVFKDIMKDLLQRFPDQKATYQDFVHSVRQTMIRLKGDSFTVEMGHLMDRVVLGSLKDHETESTDPKPLSFWLTLLSLALNSPVPERIQILYQVLQAQDETVTISDVRDMVGYLQDTCQLVPDSQVIPTDQKYPIQQYERGTPEKLIVWEGTEHDPVDIDAFSSILRSKSVCAWGECYHKKKFV
jgi:hypothetical protein